MVQFISFQVRKKIMGKTKLEMAFDRVGKELDKEIEKLDNIHVIEMVGDNELIELPVQRALDDVREALVVANELLCGTLADLMQKGIDFDGDWRCLCRLIIEKPDKTETDKRAKDVLQYILDGDARD